MIVLAKDCEVIRELCKNRVLVATTGTFDLLHVGHITHLEYCRRFGDCLTVLMSSDARVRQKKGSNRPIITQDQRAKILDSLKVVDFVVIGYDPRSDTVADRTVGNRTILEIIRPQLFIARNPAWEQDREILKSWGTELRIEPEPVRIHATTNIIEVIIDRYGGRRD